MHGILVSMPLRLRHLWAIFRLQRAQVVLHLRKCVVAQRTLVKHRVRCGESAKDVRGTRRSQMVKALISVHGVAGKMRPPKLNLCRRLMCLSVLPMRRYVRRRQQQKSGAKMPRPLNVAGNWTWHMARKKAFSMAILCMTIRGGPICMFPPIQM